MAQWHNWCSVAVATVPLRLATNTQPRVQASPNNNTPAMIKNNSTAVTLTQTNYLHVIIPMRVEMIENRTVKH